MADCPFCAIIRGEAPATIVHRWPDAVAIVPLNPVTPGHLLVIPVEHMDDALEQPVVTGAVMQRAAALAQPPCNLITSVGPEATQTIRHLHVHIVPRTAGDGLALPWGRPRCTCAYDEVDVSWSGGEHTVPGRRVPNPASPEHGGGHA
jgi:histidine triad (HIT) family protein